MKSSVEYKVMSSSTGKRENMSEFLPKAQNRLFSNSFWKGRIPANLPKIKEMFANLLQNCDIRHCEVGGVQVVIDMHAMQRVEERAWFENPEDVVKTQLTSDVLTEVLTYDITWSDEKKTTVPANPDSRIVATAVIMEGVDLIPVYEAGLLYVNVRTMLEKKESCTFLPGTRVLYVDKNGKILGGTLIQKKHATANIHRSIREIIFR